MARELSHFRVAFLVLMLLAVATMPASTQTSDPRAAAGAAVSGILIEAEDEAGSSIRPPSERPAPNTEEIAPAWRPPYSGSGDWYLAVGGEFLRYRVIVPTDATYYVWVRDYVDRFQPRGVRRIVVEFDGRTYGTFPEVDKDAPGDRGVFGWHRIGSGVRLEAGTHTMTVTKEATTTGAAILDAFYLTIDVNDRPRELPADTDTQYTSVAPQPAQQPPSSAATSAGETRKPGGWLGGLVDAAKNAAKDALKQPSTAAGGTPPARTTGAEPYAATPPSQTVSGPVVREREPNNDAATAMLVQPGTTVDAALTAGSIQGRATDIDFYRVPVAAPGLYTITVTPTLPDCNYSTGLPNLRGARGPSTMTVELAGQQRTDYTLRFGGRPEERSSTAGPEPRELLVAVDTEAWNSSSDRGVQCVQGGAWHREIPYRLTVTSGPTAAAPPAILSGPVVREREPNSDAATAMLVQPGTTVDAALTAGIIQGRGTDIDFYRVPVASPGLYTITVTPTLADCNYSTGLTNLRGARGPSTMTVELTGQQRTDYILRFGGRPEERSSTAGPEPRELLVVVDTEAWSASSDRGVQCVQGGAWHREIPYRLTITSGPATAAARGTTGNTVTPTVPPPAAPPSAPGGVVRGRDFGEPAASSGRISNIVTAHGVRNGAPVDIADSFSQDVNLIHVWFRLAGFAPGTALASRWTYLGGSAPQEIGTGDFTIAPTNDYGTFSYELAAGKRWPTGEYRIEILFGGAVLGSTTFSVRPAQPPVPSAHAGPADDAGALAASYYEFSLREAVRARETGEWKALQSAGIAAEAATDLNPDRAEYWVLLGDLYRQMPGFVSHVMADDAFEHAVALDPRHRAARLALGQLKFDDGFYASALDHLEVVAREIPPAIEPGLVAMMNIAYLEDREYARGVAFWRAYLGTAPEADAARLALAIVLNEQQEVAAARAELGRVADRPGASTVNRAYARTLQQAWARQEVRRGVSAMRGDDVWRAELILARGLALAPARRLQPVAVQTPDVTEPPIDVLKEAAEIDAWREAQFKKLKGTPDDTHAKRREIDEEALAKARRRHAELDRDGRLRKKFADAGLKEVPRYTGTAPADNAGVLQDIDLASVSAKDFGKLAKTPGAKVVGDSIIFEDLQVVVHRAPAENFAPVGSSASETGYIGHASSKETGVAFHSQDPYLSTLDNLKKGGHLLGRDSATLKIADWSEFAKMTLRNMEAAGITSRTPNLPAETEAFLIQLHQLKDHKSADSVLTPDHATEAQRVQAQEEFHKRASAANREALQVTKANDAATEAALKRQVETAPDPVTRQHAREKWITRKAVVTASEQRVGGQVLNDLLGRPAGDKRLPPSRVNEAAVKPGRTALKDAVKPLDRPVPTAKPASGIVKYGGGFLAVVGAVFGGIAGAEQARKEALPGESFAWTAAKGTGYGVLFTLGIPDAFRIGREAGNDAMRQFQADVAAGKNPSLATAQFWGAVTGVGRFGEFIGKGLVIDPAVTLAEFGVKVATERDPFRDQALAELGRLHAEQEQSRQALGIARNLARDLAAAVKAADAEINLLRPVTAHVEETRRLTNELRTKLDALRTANDIHCRRAAAASALPAARAPVDPTLPAELADIAKQADGVCRAADQAVSDFRGQRLTTQGVSFRLDNAVRRPHQDVERRLDAARRNVDAVAGSANRDAALLQVAGRTYEEAAALSQQAMALAASIDTTTAVFQQELAKRREAAAQVADMRQAFINGVKRFQGVIADQDAEWLGLVHDVSQMTIDVAALAELEAAASRFAALSALLTNDIATRVPPPCPALAALADRWDTLSQEHGDLEAALNDAAARVSAGRMCLARLSGLVPGSTPVPSTTSTRPPTPPTTSTLPPTPPPPPTPPLGANSRRADQDACVKAVNAARERYESARRSLANVRDPKQASLFSCSDPGERANWQETPPAACCTAFERDRSRGVDGAWAAMQECGWRAEIEKRRQALAQATDRCPAAGAAGR